VLPSFAHGEGPGQGVTVRPSDKKLLEARPQQVLTVPLLVTNQTKQARELTEKVELPEGWRLVAREFPFRLDPGEDDVRLVSFRAPLTAAAGAYPITYRVLDPRDPQIRAEESLRVMVIPVIRIAVSLLEIPERVIAGRPYEATFEVASHSNVVVGVSLSIDSSDNFPASIEPKELELRPGARHKVTAKVGTAEDLRKQLRHRLRLSARTEHEKRASEDSASAQIEVIPRVTGELDPYRRIPGQMQTSFGYEDDETNLQFETSGAGYLDDSHSRYVDFLFRQPIACKEILFGFQEEYRFSFVAPRHEFHLGDRGYGLSPLTEQYRFGRGIETTLKKDSFHAGGYYMETHLEDPTEEQVAATAGCALADQAGLDFHGLEKKKAEGDDDLLSVDAFVRPLEDLKLGAEYSSGWDSENGDTERDDAWRVDLQGNLGDQAWLYLEKIRAGAGFPGFFQDVEHTRATLTLSLLENLRLHTSFAEERNNIDSDPAQSAAPRSQRYHVDLTYYFPTNTYLSLAGGREDRKDILTPRDFDDEARRLAVVAGHSFKRISLRASAGPLRVHDNLTGRSTTQLAYRTDVGFSPTARQRYSAFLARGHESLIADPDQEKTLGLSASYEVAQRLTFNTSYEKRGLGDTEMETDQFLASLWYQFRHGHILSLEALYLDFREPEVDDNRSVLVAYAVPFGMPVAKRTDIAVLRGRIFDAEAPGLPGLPDLIVYIGGMSAVTDARGQFVFPALKAGVHYIWVETASLAKQQVPRQKMPMKVELAGGDRRKVDISVTRSATLAIRATRFRPAEGTGILVGPEQEKQVVEVGGFPNLNVELSREDEALHRMTDLEGRLVIRNLRPGRWKLTVPPQKLPKLHHAEQGEFDLDLEPGQSQEISVKILPRFRRMIFLDEEEE